MLAVTTAPERSTSFEYRFPLTASDYKVELAEVMMPNRRTLLCLTAAWPLAAALPGAALAQDGSEHPPELPKKKAKYYFNIREVNVGKHGDQEVAKIARDFFEKELQSRPEFTSE